jgi:predicted DNA-binding transcriptional regulator YafY
MKLDRLLAITMLLLNRKRITAAELAEYFEVSMRTIYRDIEAINQAGIPIVAYQGAGGGLGIMENYKIDRRIFSAEDINSIIIALKGASTTLDDQTFANAMAKLKILVPEVEEKSLQPDQLILDFSPWGGNKSQQAKIDLIKKAINESLLVVFNYTNFQGETVVRLVEPMVLILKSFTWYCYGYCRIRDDYRNFRLSRMKELKATEEHFQRREKCLDNLRLEHEWRPMRMIELILRFTPRLRALVEDHFDAEKVTIEPDGYLRVKTEFPDDEWSSRFILSYGDEVEVLEPEDFRELIREKARRVAEMYGRG